MVTARRPDPHPPGLTVADARRIHSVRVVTATARPDAYRPRLTLAHPRDLAFGVRLLFDAAPVPPGHHHDERELTGGEHARGGRA